ncbi:hypothetical protein AB0M36_36840 [Actinoplanes sp. NPDC051346]|uniref:hypothetical protein n=1 Tax=Actinoplanes sp. NPDC051346 TaxID=3155048 RepID=UPI0034220906
MTIWRASASQRVRGELRALLRQAVDELAQDPRGVRARDALTAGVAEPGTASTSRWFDLRT